jgi:hypothetical protein
MRIRPLITTLLALGVTVCAALGRTPVPSASATAAPAYQALVVGKTTWTVLGGNTGAGAQAFGDEMVAAGYDTTIDTNGRFVDQVFQEVPSQEVLFIHGHGHPGAITTEDTSATGRNQYFFAQIPVGTLWDVQPPPQIVEWDDYLPSSQVDDLLLAVLSACQTAEADPTWGSLPEMLPTKGVDTVVTIFGLPLIPGVIDPTPLAYGNYYWARVGYYLRTGNSVNLALSKGVQDLIAAEGSASGWNRYHITGAAQAPEATTIVPPRPGTSLLPTKVRGLLPGSASSLTVTSTMSETLPTGRVIDNETAEQITTRRDALTGQLLGAWGMPALTGPETFDREQAVSLAEEFLSREIPGGYTIGRLRSTRTEPLKGARLLSTEIRYHDASKREGLAIIEVDLRAGNVVTFNLAHAPKLPTREATLTQDKAEALALQIAGEGTVVDAQRRDWTDSRWVVTIDQGERDGHDQIEEVAVDAVDGRILAQATS